MDQVLMRKISHSLSEYKIQLEHRTLNYGEMTEAGEGPAHMILCSKLIHLFSCPKYVT